MRLTKRQLKRIIREEYSRLKRKGLIKEDFGGRYDWLGEWYEDNGGYYKDADCFSVLDECVKDGGLATEEIFAVVDEMRQLGFSSIEELKQSWIEERKPVDEWYQLYRQSDALQDLFWAVHDWRQQKYGPGGSSRWAGMGGDKYPPAKGPDSKWCGGPAFVTAVWCLAQ